MNYGFVGLGIMGSRMAERLLEAGFKLSVWNRDASKAQALKAKGASVKESLKELAQEADFVFVMVSDPQASLEICFAEDGLLNALRPGSSYIEMSTIDPESSKKLESALEAKGIRYLEAPVSGTKKPAADGTLLILAAGNQELYHEVQAALQVLGKRLWYLGEVGQGAKMKILVNLVMGAMMEALAEAFSLSKKCGLEPEDLLAVLAEGALANPLFKSKGELLLTEDFSPSFPLKHLAKDLRLALELGESLGQKLPVSDASHRVFLKAQELGFGDADIAAVIRSFE